MKITKDKLKQIIREELASLDENRALDNAIKNRDENRANSKSEFKEFQSLYFDMNNAIRKVSKNNKSLYLITEFIDGKMNSSSS